MLIGLKGDNYYSKVFKRVNYHSLKILEPFLFICWFEQVCVLLVYL